MGAAELAHGSVEVAGLLQVAQVTCAGDHDELGVGDRVLELACDTEPRTASIGLTHATTDADPASWQPIPALATKLRVRRARVDRDDRVLDVYAPITSLAQGDADVTFQADGRTDTFDARVTEGDIGGETLACQLNPGQTRTGPARALREATARGFRSGPEASPVAAVGWRLGV